MKKVAWYLILALAVLVTACGGGAANPTAAPEGASGGNTTAGSFAVYAVNSEPLTNWDPAIEFSNGIHVVNNMYEQLVRYDPAAKKTMPLLADSYTVSQDGLTWTFKLHPGVTFQNGDPMKAADVKYSIERTKRLNAGASYIWSAVDTITAIDDTTVEFKLAYPAPLDLVASTGYAAFIYSAKCVDAQDAWLPEAKGCGTGPYQLKSAKWGDEIILEKYDGYWRGWGDRFYQTVVVKKVSEAATRRQMIETGDATVTVELPFSDVDALKNNPAVNVMVEPSLQNLYVMLNSQKPPLDKPEVRQALAYAFPYEEVIKYAVGGYAQQSFGAVPAGLWGWSDKLPRYEYNLEKAQELLNQAGLGEGGLKLLLTYTAGNEAEKSMAELFKAELAKLKIDLEIRGMPWDSQWELGKSTNIADRQDIFVMYWWPDLPSPYSFLFSPFHSEEEVLFNLGYYNNPEFDKLIDQANEITSVDQPKAEEMFVQAQEMLLKDAATIFAYDRQDVWVTAKSFTGFKFNPAYPTVIFFYETSPAP